MWIMLSGGFLSIVDNSYTKGELLVRARREGDIEKVFPDAVVTSVEGRDYLYRASVKREDVAEAMHAQVMGINYPNFKDSVGDDTLHSHYAQVWGVMSRLQKTPPYHVSTKGKRSLPAHNRYGMPHRITAPMSANQAQIVALKRNPKRGL